MAHEGRVSFHVRRPVAEVFAYVSNLELAPEWVPDLVSVRKTSTGPLGVGTRYDEVVHMGGRMAEAQLEVTEYSPPRVFAHRGQGGPAHFSARFLFTPEEPGTLVTHEWEVRLSGMFRLMSPLASNWVRKNVEAGMENLRRRLERSASAGGS